VKKGNKNREIIPISTVQEDFLNIAATISSIAPWIGGPVSSVLSGMSVSRKIERINEVLINMAEEIKGLESEIPKDYVKTDEFQELLEKTLQQVSNERNDEKRRAYATLLANDIKNPAHDIYEEKIRFLRTLEEIQPNHIHILRAMMLKPDPNSTGMSSVSKTLEKRLPNIPTEKIKDLAEQLTDMRLANLTNLNTMMTGIGAEQLQSRITSYGQRFIKYIISEE
jgi:hypothetical protein